jgi:uncharacterized membrane protein YsdA (DUF1294 family)
MVTLLLIMLLVFVVLALVSAASYWIDKTVERHDRSGRQ